MLRFLRNFDNISFWLGFLAASVFWGLVHLLRPWLNRFLQGIRDQSQVVRMGTVELIEVRIRNDVMRYAQGSHLAAPLFSLEEIVIPPRLLFPPASTEPGVLPPTPDVTELVMPYLPDMPELASFYGAPTISPLEALGGDAHLALLGHPGSGKSVALAHLAIQFARQTQLPPALSGMLPLLIHAGDIQLETETSPETLLLPVLNAAARLCPSVQTVRLQSHLANSFAQGKVLLLLDGIDELPSNEIRQLVAYLSRLLQEYPNIRVVAAISPVFYGDLTRLNFVPLGLAAWDEAQRREFINRWSDLWTSQLGSEKTDSDAIDPILLNAWLTNETAILSPLELTLKVWGVYAGDLKGAKRLDWIEAYLQRMCAGISNGYPALELLAGSAILAGKPVFEGRDTSGWLKDIEPLAELQPINEAPTPEGSSGEPPDQKDTPASQPAVKPIRDSRVIPTLIESGLLLNRSGDRLGFNHPLLLSYLAASDQTLRSWRAGAFPAEPWSTAWYTLGFLAARQNDASAVVKPFIEPLHEPLCREPMIAARWLRFAPDNVPWRNDSMRQLIKILQNDANPLGLRSRALIAAALSGSPGLENLFRQFLVSPDGVLRQLACLGCGLLRDAKAVNDLVPLLNASDINIQRAASLALIAIGHQNALEAVAETLLHGNEDQRRAAAESLANNLEEGHPTLKEGSTIEDVMVRRAVVYGLRRVRQPWGMDTLQQLQVSDTQWVVKDAATQVLEEITQTSPRLPKAMPELTETPWLIQFAGQRGIGIAPGKPALELLLLALREGKEEQKLAALETLNRFPEESAVAAVIETYVTNHNELREAAFQTLWHYAGTGIDVGQLSQVG